MSARGIGAVAPQPAKRARLQEQGVQEPREEEKEEGENREEDEDEEDDGVRATDILGEYDFAAEAFQKARYSDRLFTTVLSPGDKAKALKGLTVKPSNAPDLALPDLDVDPMVPDLSRNKVGEIGLKVKDIAPLFKSLAKADQRMALLILNMVQLLGEIDTNNQEKTLAMLVTAQKITQRMAEVAEVGRSEKAIFKAAVFMHAKQRQIPLNAAIKMLNRKEQASVFTEPHVKDAMVSVANFNDAMEDIGGSFRGARGGRGNFQAGQRARAYVTTATFREPQQRFQDRSSQQHQQPQQPYSSQRGRGGRGQRGRARGTFRGRRHNGGN